MKNQNGTQNSSRKTNFPARMQIPQQHLATNPFRNNFNEHNEIDSLFTFNPIKSLRFLEDNLGKSANSKNDSLLTSLENLGKIRSRLLESTTIEDSLKKHSNTLGLTNNCSNSTSFSPAQQPAKLQHQLEQSLLGKQTLPNEKNADSIYSPPYLAKRTRSLNFHNLHQENSDQRTSEQALSLPIDPSERIKLLKTQNVGKTKVLNVDLSKNYIMAYKKANTDEMDQIEKSKKILAMRMRRQGTQEQKPAQEGDLLAEFESFVSFQQQCSLEAKDETLQATGVHNSTAKEFKSPSRTSSDLKKLMPQTLTSFFDSRTGQSISRRCKSKPKVFDFYKHCQAHSGKPQHQPFIKMQPPTTYQKPDPESRSLPFH